LLPVPTSARREWTGGAGTDEIANQNQLAANKKVPRNQRFNLQSF
jgi:hypothetical protein